MVKTGIKKYDELPGRVGFKDVDYLRYKLANCLLDCEKIKLELEACIKKWKEKVKI